MTGAANTDIIDAFIVESTPGTTPTTPAFTKASFDQVSLKAVPRLSEAFARATYGQRSAIGRNGIQVTGSAVGKLIYGEYDDFFASLFQADWSTNVLINGQDQIAMTLEQSAPQGVGGALAYMRFRGMEVVTAQLALKAGSDVNVNFSLIGSGADSATATMISGATYADPAETAIIGSGADIGTITMSGFTLDCMSECTIDFGVVNKEEQPRISSDDACGISRGAMRPKITGRFYVESNFKEIYNAALAGGDFALSIPLGQVSTKKYLLEFPVCEFVENPLETGENGPLYQTFTILPKYDSSTINGTARLTRAIA